MKRIFTFFAVAIVACVFLSEQAIAQAPEKMSYQAVIRNSSNSLITSTVVGMKISILQGSISGTVVFAETQSPTTNANGLASIEIGEGVVVTGSFGAIDWANGPYFIKTETDPAGGTSYSITGTSQLLSVPYALHAANTSGVTNYSVSSDVDPVIASTIIGSNTITEVLQITGVPAGTYAVFFSCPLRNLSTSSIGLNVAWAVTTNDATPEFPVDGIATSFIPASGWTANYVFGQSGFKVVTLGTTGTIELKTTYYGALLTGTVSVAGTAMMRAIKL